MKYSIGLLGSIVLALPAIGYAITDATNITTTLLGEASNDLQFSYVRTAGDINADGYDDFLISKPLVEDDDASTDWRVYLIYGAANIASTVSLDDAVQIGTIDSAFGVVAGACDMNGDGYDDFVIGGNGQEDTAAAFVQYGQAETLTDRTSDDLIAIRVEANTTDSTYIKTIACAGDTDSDGYDDLALGSTEYSAVNESAGAVYLVYGQAEQFSNNELVAAIRFTGSETDSGLGAAVVGAGDMNGDGLADVLISAPGKSHKGDNAGAVYLAYGRSNRYTNRAAKYLPKLYGKNSNDFLGFQMGAAGDINNDGYDDTIVVAPYYKDKNDKTVGAIYLLYGRASKYTTGSVGRFEHVRGQNSKAEIDDINKTPGDVNGDGFSDLLASGIVFDTTRDYKGLAYLLRGRAKKYTTQRLTQKQYGYVGFADQYYGGVYSFIGDAISFIGDVDGSGRSDVVLIDGSDDEAGRNFGKIYLIFN